MGMKWFCAAVTLSEESPEDRAADTLEAAGFNVYLPLQFHRATTGSKKPAVTVSLRFSRYIFIQMDTDLDHHSRVAGLKGINLLCTHDEAKTPMPLFRGEMDALRKVERRERAEMASKRTVAAPDMPLGSKVRIHRHATFAGQVGTLMSVVDGVAWVSVGGFAVMLNPLDIKPVAPTTQKRFAA